jgi:outer membrane protein
VNKWLLSCVLAAAVAAPFVPARAEPAPRFGYVDLRKVITESKTGKQGRAELEKLIKGRQEQLEKEAQKFRALQQDIEKNQLVMNEQQKKDKQKELQDKAQALQKLKAEADQEVAKKDAELTQKAYGELRAIVAELAKEQKLMMVFDKHAQPLYAEPGPDLTDKVIQKYDARAGK